MKLTSLMLLLCSAIAPLGCEDGKLRDGNGDECSCVDFGAYNVCGKAVEGASCAAEPDAICPAEFTNGHGDCSCSGSLRWSCGARDLGGAD